jgi:hypothetical protein
MSNFKKAKEWNCSLLGKHIIGMCVLMFFLSSSVLYAESKLIDKTIKGTEVDDAISQPIARANVVIKEGGFMYCVLWTMKNFQQRSLGTMQKD